MPLDTLRKAIQWGMKENLLIHYVYPEYDLPKEYETLIESIEHVKIGRDVVVCRDIPSVIDSRNIVLRISVTAFIEKIYDIAMMLPQIARLNICLLDIESFSDKLIDDYKKALCVLNGVLFNLYKSGKKPQVNIITDRLGQSEMNNCGAGDTNITIAPNGKFYHCPAFYYDEKLGISNQLNHHKPSPERNVGDLEEGLQISNPQLLRLSHAPLCRTCDAFHCNRCIWLNQKLTWEINTPSHQQCVLSHLERNASRDLQLQLEKEGIDPENRIKEINYLDPYDEIKKNFRL